MWSARLTQTMPQLLLFLLGVSAARSCPQLNPHILQRERYSGLSLTVVLFLEADAGCGTRGSGIGSGDNGFNVEEETDVWGVVGSGGYYKVYGDVWAEELLPLSHQCFRAIIYLFYFFFRNLVFRFSLPIPSMFLYSIRCQPLLFGLGRV